MYLNEGPPHLDGQEISYMQCQYFPLRTGLVSSYRWINGQSKLQFSKYIWHAITILVEIFRQELPMIFQNN